MRKLIAASVALTLCQAMTCIAPSAQTLTVAVRIPITSLDPQLSGLTSDIGYNENIYSTLFQSDPVTLQSLPGLATGFERLDALTWRLDLRKGVKFHNGQDFTAADVLASFKRLPTVPNSDGLLYNYARPIKSIDEINPHTIKITTSAPTPDLISRLQFFSVICRCVPEGSSTEDFNTGKAAIGTGPFKLVEWTRGNHLVLARFDDYWGEKAAFDKAVVREMPNDASRIASLMAGDVDVIDYVPPADMKRLSTNSKVKIFSVESTRTLMLPVNSMDDPAPLVTDAAGKPLPKSPLKDLRVRQALKAAISQDVLVSRVMEGAARPITQGVTSTAEMFSPQVAAARYEPDRAKKLLAEAGFPNGFGLTLGCPNDRYVNDADICQAIAQMWARIGLTVKVDAVPKAVFFKKAMNREYPVFLQGWGRSAPDDPTFLTEMVASRDKAAGRGSWNGAYSNPQIDKEIDAALGTADEAVRRSKLQEIMRASADDVAYIPLYSQMMIMAGKADLTAEPSSVELTPIYLIRKAK